jgi:hypothetical protein
MRGIDHQPVRASLSAAAISHYPAVEILVVAGFHIDNLGLRPPTRRHGHQVVIVIKRYAVDSMCRLGAAGQHRRRLLFRMDCARWHPERYGEIRTFGLGN